MAQIEQPYIVQSLDLAYSNNIPWHKSREERFATLADARRGLEATFNDRTYVGGDAAVRRAGKTGRRPRRICDHGSWNGHERIILAPDAEPVTLTWTLHCLQVWGHGIYDGAPGCRQATTVTAVWEPGQPAPEAPVPADWQSHSQCQACADLQRRCEEQEYASHGS